MHLNNYATIKLFNNFHISSLGVLSGIQLSIFNYILLKTPYLWTIWWKHKSRKICHICYWC